MCTTGVTPDCLWELHGWLCQEVERLEKVNFTQRMRCFYLEEQLSRCRDGAVQEGSVERELVDLKVQLEERDREIQERTELLVKARSAIQRMQAEIDHLNESYNRDALQR